MTNRSDANSLSKLLGSGLIGGSLLLGSCTKLNNQQNHHLFGDDLSKAAKIYSTRPTNEKQSILIIKLQAPALLSALLEDKLKKVIDPKLLATIKKEQEQAIKDIKAASPEALILYQYRMVLNAVVIAAPIKDLPALEKVTNVSSIKTAQTFERPQALYEHESPKVENLEQNNSVLFIGAKAALDKNMRGQNIRVGIIDTGIDYTHAMLGGSGDAQDYRDIKPNEDSNKFPNLKVVGGLDFAGSEYDAGSENLAERIPKKDNNPIDEGGHGTHVAGTVAGIGDYENSYNGVAPTATLYALKVFGARGSTSDEVVISALEYAADPNGDDNIEDHLDVVNLSLGSSYGTPRIFYNQAIKNLTLGGTVVVASAGNSGDISYIVGAPSVSNEALSVAASVDGMDHNWKFNAITAQLADKSLVNMEAVEAVISKPLKDLEQMQGSIVYVGKLATEPSENEKILMKGKLALIDRGVSTFEEKIKRASESGAIGVLVANNTDDDPFTMGGGKAKYEIPAMMISKSSGLKIREGLKLGEVTVDLKSNKQVEKPQLIDTITDFSSRGPRSEDSLIKPEISAPGQNIVSAAMGKGKGTVQMSGTSMSGPHMAGVMALMKQYYPELSVAELKSLVMGTAKSQVDKNQKNYSISRVGAGRVQIDKAMNASLVSDVSSLSLGSVKVDQKKVFYKNIKLRNIKPDKVQVKAIFEGHPALTMEPVSVELGPKQLLDFEVKLALTADAIKDVLAEVDGYVKFYQEKEEVFRLPVLAIVRKISAVTPEMLTVNSTSKVDSEGAMVQLKLSNPTQNEGITYPMNLIGLDERKKDSQWDEYRSRACDLQGVGYKVVGYKIYVGFKIYQQVTTWDLCELNIQIDSDGDGKADQEIVGTPISRLPGLVSSGLFMTLNLDANIARDIRKSYDFLDEKEKQKKALSFVPAILDVQEMAVFDHSSFAMLIIDRNKIKLSPTGEVNAKFSVSSMEQYSVESDDFLGNDETSWRKWDITTPGQSYIFAKVDEKIAPKETKTVTLTKGQGLDDMIIFTPSNKAILNSFIKDDQSEVISPNYLH